MAHEIQVFANAETLAQAAAQALVESAQHACAARGRFVLCLAGGRTPERVYELLATPALAQHIDWHRVEIVFGDERSVSPDDPASNFGMAWRALLRHVPVPNDQLHRMQGELAPPQARVAEVIEGPRNLEALPAQRIQSSGRLCYMLDQAAAAQLTTQ
jgi:6-phosphogluconolactonase